MPPYEPGSFTTTTGHKIRFKSMLDVHKSVIAKVTWLSRKSRIARGRFHWVPMVKKNQKLRRIYLLKFARLVKHRKYCL